MVTQNPLGPNPDSLSSARSVTSMQRRWLVLLLLGIVQILSGVIALAVPTAASLAAAIVFGAVLVVTGVFQVVHAFGVRRWKGVTLQALGGLLYVAAGILVLVFPLSGVLTLTIIVATLLIADGAVRSFLAYRVKPLQGWGWFMAAGIASMALGIMLLIGWPLTGLWAIGMLLGVSLVFSGVTNSVLAIMFRKTTTCDSEREAVEAAHRLAE